MTSGQIPIWSTVCKKLIIKSDGYPTVSRASWKLARLVHTSSKRKSHLSSRRVLKLDMEFSIFSMATVSKKSSRIRTYGRLELFVIGNEFETFSTNRHLKSPDKISCLDEILCVTCFHFQGTSRSLKKIENYFKAPSSSDVPDGIKIVATGSKIKIENTRMIWLRQTHVCDITSS